MRRNNRIATMIAACLLLSGCEKPPATEQASSPSSGAAPVSWVLTSEPTDVKSVVDVKASASEGDRVVMRARIGGRRDPMTAGSPVFSVMDVSLAHCGENPDDTCATPWDYCCETPDTKRAKGATVQIVGTDGQPVAGDASSGGLKPLDEVVLVGTVGPRPTPDVLTILASGVYRVGP